MVSNDVSSDYSTEEFLRLMGTGDFFPLTVEVIPDLAARLFDEAVRAAETSLNELRKGRAHLEEATTQNEGSWVMAVVLAGHNFDMSLRRAISSVICAVASAEAQVNHWAEQLGGWNENEDRLPVDQKMKALAARAQIVLDLGFSPFQRICVAVSRRNEYAHSKPAQRSMPLTGDNVAVPGTSISAEAREACLGVRQAMTALAKTLSLELPRYLSTCPPSDPPTEESWGGAVILDGVREDPDFPKRVLDVSPARESP
jgi:hypothetical protein